MSRTIVQASVVEQTASKPPAGDARVQVAWLYALFFLSGVSGLMYEVVWVRMLTRTLGCTVYATSTVLAAFMGGLAIGSLVVGRRVDRWRSPLLWYACMELGIGAAALASLVLPDRLLPVYRSIFEFAGGLRAWLTLGQVVVALAVLGVPTSLMGATLPTLSTFGARRASAFGSYVGSLYGLNTLGGVVGVLASGFVLLGAVGETQTVLWGVAINGVVAIGALALQRQVAAAGAGATRIGADSQPPTERTPPLQESASDSAQLQFLSGIIVVACSAGAGFVSLANEVVWSRMLVVYQGTSIYAFSAMLAVVLAAMTLGSLLVARFVDRSARPLRLFGRIELASALAGAVALWAFEWLSGLPQPDLTAPRRTHLLSLALTPLALLAPMAILWGGAFPAAVRCYTSNLLRAGQSVSVLYAWNTIGCIAGALAAGYGLIPLLGASHTAAVLSSLALVMGLLLLACDAGGSIRRGYFEWAVAGVCLLLLVMSGDPYSRLVRQRIAETFPKGVTYHRHVEDASGTMTVFDAGDAAPRGKQLWVNGVGMTVLSTSTKLMAHLPIWLADEPKQVLVVCFGMGTTFRSASRHGDLEVWSVELIPSVPECFAFFHPTDADLLERPKLHVVADDGRNFLLMRSRLYDVITIDPAPPLYSAATVNLYSREFFELCRSRIRDGGVVCLWIPPANLSEVKMILRTFVDVFEHTSVWEGPDYAGIYVCGRKQAFDAVEERIRRGFRDPSVVADLVEWGADCDTPEKVLRLHICDGHELRPFLADTPGITDDRPYTEFPLWRAQLNPQEYRRMMHSGVLRYILSAAQSRPLPGAGRPP